MPKLGVCVFSLSFLSFEFRPSTEIIDFYGDFGFSIRPAPKGVLEFD